MVFAQSFKTLKKSFVKVYFVGSFFFLSFYRDVLKRYLVIYVKMCKILLYHYFVFFFCAHKNILGGIYGNRQELEREKKDEHFE